jgi:hypothetical protein
MAAAAPLVVRSLFGFKDVSTSAASRDGDEKEAKRKKSPRRRPSAAAGAVEDEDDDRDDPGEWHDAIVRMWTVPRKPLGRDVDLRFEIYREPAGFGDMMKPGKSPAAWGPERWFVYGTMPIVREHVYDSLVPRPVVPVSVSTLRLWVEVQPFVIGCGKCRMSFGIAVAKRPVRKEIGGLDSVTLFFNYVHNRVNRRFNADPANDALPRKPIVDDDRHRAAWKRVLRDFMADRRATDPPDFVLAAFFQTLYYEADHYPDARDNAAITQRRLHYRIDFGLWCDLLPPGTVVHRAFGALFYLGDQFADLHRRLPTVGVQELVDAAAKLPEPTIWRDCGTLLSAVHELEIAVRGRSRVVPLATREELVRRSATTVLPPIAPRRRTASASAAAAASDTASARVP